MIKGKYQKQGDSLKYDIVDIKLSTFFPNFVLRSYGSPRPLQKGGWKCLVWGMSRKKIQTVTLSIPQGKLLR